jgi:hypothetical protein
LLLRDRQPAAVTGRKDLGGVGEQTVETFHHPEKRFPVRKIVAWSSVTEEH